MLSDHTSVLGAMYVYKILRNCQYLNYLRGRTHIIWFFDHLALVNHKYQILYYTLDLLSF